MDLARRFEMRLDSRLYMDLFRLNCLSNFALSLCLIQESISLKMRLAEAILK